MKKSLFLLFIFVPFFAFGDAYQDVAGASQMVADSFGEMWGYFFDDVPSMFQRLTGWAVAKVIIQDLNIMSQITSQISLLPQDVRQALIDMRLFDGMNLLFNAYMTRFVMNFIR